MRRVRSLSRSARWIRLREYRACGVREYERGSARLGRLTAKGPGLIFLLPLGIERMVKVPLRIVAMDIPPQDVITRDNVSIKVNAVVYFRVSDPVKATIVIEDYLFATSQLAQTTLRSVVGQAELDQLLAEREHFNDIVRASSTRARIRGASM
jgi:regulator of protease activity HflC (stomatin/prohibitin superfamily)